MADAPQSFPDRLTIVVQRCAAKLGPDVGEQLLGLVSPRSLAIMAAFLIGWVVGHAVGVGELVDIVIAVVGFFSVGLAVFSGLDQLFQFGRTALEAKSDRDLDVSADHLARAIAILGVQTILAILAKGAARSFPKAGRIAAGEEPPRTPGLRSKPSTVRDPSVPAEGGSTTFWGDVKLATRGAASEQEVARLHEAFHQFLAPKFYVLRRFRVENRVHSYFESSLYRYIEEALAEAIGRWGAYGFKRGFTAVRFPVENGYVYLTKSGGYSPAMAGGGVLPEGAALIAAGVIQEFGFQVWFRQCVPNPRADNDKDKRVFGRHAEPFVAGRQASR